MSFGKAPSTGKKCHECSLNIDLTVLMLPLWTADCEKPIGSAVTREVSPR